MLVMLATECQRHARKGSSSDKLNICASYGDQRCCGVGALLFGSGRGTNNALICKKKCGRKLNEMLVLKVDDLEKGDQNKISIDLK